MATVLIVEDEAIVAADLELLLRRMGHEPVGSASTGLDAILKARNLAPDLILMDVRLRGAMNGIEAARQIRAERPVAIVFTTAMRVPTDELARGSRYVSKPFNALEISDAIEAVRAEM